MSNITSLESKMMTDEAPLDLILTVSDIMKLIPHRPPFLFVDKVIDIVPFQKATGLKMVTMNEWFFQGHFPNHPIMPGVLIVEALAQTAGVLVAQSHLEINKEKSLQENVVYFMTIEEAKFRNPVTPGGVLKLVVEKEKQRGNVWRFKGKALFNDKVASEATFTAMIVIPE
ncbi:MAG: 3-hydroxyacyl-[acyl-carrier-protein] dehydratase FabZ [Holosporales bacterium]